MQSGGARFKGCRGYGAAAAAAAAAGLHTRTHTSEAATHTFAASEPR